MFFVWWFQGFFVPLHCSSKTERINNTSSTNTKTKRIMALKVKAQERLQTYDFKTTLPPDDGNCLW